MDVATTVLRRARGFTLIELLTTLVVTGVSLAILVPSWSGLANRSQIRGTANQLLTHLRYARNEAVSRNMHISLCPSDDGISCSRDPRGWQRGYLVFVDDDRDRDRTPNETLLRIQGAQHRQLQLHSTAGRPAVKFRPDGAAWSTNTTFSVCVGDDPDSNRAVVLYGTGRARVDRRLPRNRAVTCT